MAYLHWYHVLVIGNGLIIDTADFYADGRNSRINAGVMDAEREAVRAEIHGIGRVGQIGNDAA